MKNSNYTLDDLVMVAARENNQRRKYLYVDPLQGKHIPVSPDKCLSLFSKLSDIIENHYRKEKLLVIGFAETATAIGMAAAVNLKNVLYFMTTTRENVPDAEYLYFTEAHSHASIQKLVLNDLDECLKSVDRIVFVEDEVTTGNTIEQLINALNKKFYGIAHTFGIVSILNSMTDERLSELEGKGIECDYICRLPFEYRIDSINSYIYNKIEDHTVVKDFDVNILRFKRYFDCRIVQNTNAIRTGCNEFVGDALENLYISSEKSILVLGTEEFMYPAIILGNSIKQKYPDVQVRVHASTRSPIMTSDCVDYPLYNRSELDSIYESGRNTYIYNLAKYDKVIIVTDTYSFNKNGAFDLLTALLKHENKNVVFLHWGGDETEKQLF